MCNCNSNNVTRSVDIEDVSNKFDEYIHKKFPKPTEEDISKYEQMLRDLIQGVPLLALKKQYKFSYKNSYLYTIFLKHRDTFTKEEHAIIKNALKINPGKSNSGIISVTVFTSPYPEYTDSITGNVVKQSFSCEFNCHYCPNEPGQPRSYLKGEPGVLRANRESFDCVKQMYIRLEALFLTGHDIDKLEILVLGGTWSSYPKEYRETFVRDIYYAANTFEEHISNVLQCNVPTTVPIRERLTMTEEKILNRTAKTRIIGLTLETRPDQINKEELILFRHYGCTRVQLGVQHIDNDILTKINRKCPHEITVRAIQLLKDCCFKVDIHLMPNLPGSSLEKDDQMFRKFLGVQKKTYVTLDHQAYVLDHPELQVDQWKIYPTTITPYTQIKEWFDEGSYVPYSNEDLYNLIYRVKIQMFKCIRINRCIRDIPSDYVYDSEYHSNMRQHIEHEITKSGLRCNCIRCREVKDGKYDSSNSKTFIMEYNASGGTEFFISTESLDNSTLYGFLRLRLKHETVLNPNQTVFQELFGCALIRELHVYGKLQVHNGGVQRSVQSTQHSGIGKQLLKTAESIATNHGFAKIAVISGEGVREYYEKQGYSDSGNFLVKKLK